VQNGWVHLGAPAMPQTVLSTPSAPSAPGAPTPAPPAQPAAPAGPSAAQVERDQQAYNQARGNAAALRSYLATCQVCAMKAAAQAELAQFDRADQEDRMYQAARGNSSSLRNYVNTCQICASKLAAQAEIQQLDRTDQERQMYQNARGDVSALQRYLNACQICAYSSAARDEIQKSDRCANASAEDVVGPIRLVYQAINSRNLDLYAAQWDDTATSHDVFVNETHTKAEKVDNKRKQFNLWETVDLRMQTISLLNHSGNTATAQVTYSMTFKYAGQAPRSRSDIIEKYDLVCDASGTWLIKYNLDEINVTQ
jgi:hypothetical protein